MSAEKDDMISEELKSKIVDALINCYSHLQWSFNDGKLKGYKDNDANEYVYEYIPNSDDEQIIRLIFKQKLEPQKDTSTSIHDKFIRIEHIRLLFPDISMNDLPTDWLFIAKKTNVMALSPIANVITVHSFDSNGRLNVTINLRDIDIYGKNKLTNEESNIDLTMSAHGIIHLDLTIENSD